MSMLQKISHQQIIDRFDILPQRLKDAILSSSTSDEVWRIGQLNHLNDDKIFKLSRIVGRVLLGLIDVDDAAPAIRDYVEIPTELAASLARELKRKIFTFLGAEIASAYSPFAEITSIKTEEAHPTEVKAKPALAPAPMPSIMPREAGKITAPVPMPMPKVIEEQKVVPQGIAPMPAPVPAPAAPSPSSTPFILHKEEAVKPISGMKPIDFSFSLPETKKTETAPLVAAELELDKESFGVSEKKEPLIAKTEEPTQRIVHYSEFRTPINPFEGKPFGSAQGGPNPAIPITPPTAKEVIPAPAPMVSIPPPARIPATSAISAPAAPQPPAVPIPPKPMPLSPAPAPSVKMEGNVLDLRQNNS